MVTSEAPAVQALFLMWGTASSLGKNSTPAWEGNVPKTHGGGILKVNFEWYLAMHFWVTNYKKLRVLNNNHLFIFHLFVHQ